MTEFKVYSSRIAGELRNQGFFIIRTEPNRKKPWLSVFIYRILWIVKTIPKVSCTISFDNNTKILMDIPQGEFNFYHLMNYIKNNQ